MTQTLTASPVRTLAIDRSHSEVAFQVRHLLTKVRGRFADFAGTIEFDGTAPERSRIDVVIQAASIDTAEPPRDVHLRSADFFDVERYPTLTFTSASIEPTGPQSYAVVGDLTIHGITKRVRLAASFLGTALDPWGNERIGVEAEVTLNRKEFGLHWNAPLETGGLLVGDEVKISLSIQAK